MFPVTSSSRGRLLDWRRISGLLGSRLDQPTKFALLGCLQSGLETGQVGVGFGHDVVVVLDDLVREV